jgi:hypothetical protein
LANPEHRAKLREGVEAWNQWREENPETRPDLIKADLRGANLREADLGEAGLSHAYVDTATYYLLGLARLALVDFAGLAGASFAT